MAVPNINTALPIVYDPSCPGLCCFENTPCRYCNEGCYGQGACSAPTPTTVPTPAPTPAPTSFDCMAVPNINTGLPIVYDPSCPGLCCFENTPCRYCNEGCYGQGACSAPTPTTVPTPAPTPAPTSFDCMAVPNINTALPIVYDPSCPGLCCFENTPCRYCNEGCYGQGACQPAA
ncbi:unnamed protein product [Prorocentrum cordatum]|uniref:Subtilisin n=1 Tax=Prorocentrum cordatum TaxID=2364126 RepID=A0ABN9URN2_9DINO|nr:unnamed protein product [Polarella glacialis]